MQKIECCNTIHLGRIYNIGNNSFLVFTDECSRCGQAIAEIKHRTSTGGIFTGTRRTGKAAYRLLEKYGLRLQPYKYKTFTGTKTKEYSFNNIFGTVYNNNGVMIAPQEKFLQMSREEVNAILNKRFYTFRKA